jgi:fibronectin-binding autotransporter adhesin
MKMRAPTAKRTREANTMMALVCVTTIHLISPQAHAVDLTIYSGTTTINSNTTYGETIIGGTEGQSATLEVTSGTLTNTSSLYVGFNGIGTLTIGAGGTVMANGNVSRNPDSTINLNAGGTLQFNSSSGMMGPTTFLGGFGALTNNGTLIFNLGTGDNTSHSGVFSGSGSLIKQGSDTLTLSGANTYSGATTVSAGTLELSGANSTSGVNISGGTLLLSGSFSNAATISLGAATSSMLQLSGAVTETLGALTLAGGAGARVIDFGTGSGVLTFASLTATSSLPLQIWNWSGGTDHLYVNSGSLSGGLTTSNISFFSDGGSSLIGTAQFSGN